MCRAQPIPVPGDHLAVPILQTPRSPPAFLEGLDLACGDLPLPGAATPPGRRCRPRCWSGWPPGSGARPPIRRGWGTGLVPGGAAPSKCVSALAAGESVSALAAGHDGVRSAFPYSADGERFIKPTLAATIGRPPTPSSPTPRPRSASSTPSGTAPASLSSQRRPIAETAPGKDLADQGSLRPVRRLRVWGGSDSAEAGPAP